MVRYNTFMILRHQHNGLIWVDVESPTREEMHEVGKEFGIKHFVIEELLRPSNKPRSEFYETHSFFVLHFPTTRHGLHAHEQEVDFVVGHDFIITVRYDVVDPLHQLATMLKGSIKLGEGDMSEHAGFLLFYMLKRLYKGVEHEVDMVRKDLVQIEEHIYSGNEIEMVFEISRSARDLLNLRQSIEPHKEALHTLEVEGVKFFGPEFASYLRTLSNECYRVHNHIMRETESLHELRATNNSLLTTKQNETMKIFTIMAFVTFPLSLLVAVLNLNTESNPLRDLPYDFWIVVAIVVGAMLIMYGFFKHRKWL
jgi:magnesium transporter